MTGLPETVLTISKYQLLSKVWDGTFSETWQGKTPEDTMVAIQIIKDQKMLAQLQDHPVEIPSFRHPCIPALLAIQDNPVSCVWEYATGRRLSTYLKNLKKIKSNIALYIIRKLLEILKFLLSQGKMHGGIRPDRVLITPDKKVLLCNLGLGILEQRILAELVAREENVERSSSILPYFPEEVLKDQIFEDVKSDIYSAGMMLCEMLTGKCISIPEMPAFLRQQDIPPGLCSIILKATADFEERYNHPNEMYDDINHLLNLSDQVEKIYVAPPSKSVNIGMEAIPADSEEYRVYQADVFSARQTIEAEVVMAEPVEDIQPYAESKVINQSQTPKNPLKKTVRMDSDNILMFSTINKKILDPLEKESFWPAILGKYTLGIACAFTLLFLASAFFESKDSFCVWFFYPMYAISFWIKPLEFLGNVIVWGGLFFLSLIPFFDPHAQLRQNKVLLCILSFYLFLLFVLGMWVFLG